MSFYISKVHKTNENGEDEFIYYTGNHHWSSNPANRLTFDTAEEAATYLYEFGGAVTDVEPAPYVPSTPITTVESTPVVEEPMVTFEATPIVEEEPVINFSSEVTSSQIFNDTTSSFSTDTTIDFGISSGFNTTTSSFSTDTTIDFGISSGFNTTSSFGTDTTSAFS